MSQDVRTRPADSGDHEALDALDGSGGGPAVSTTDLLDRLWRFFISMRTGLVLILGLGLLSLIGTLLAQAPAELQSDPAAYTSWVASVHSKYGGWTPVFDKLGFFAIFTSIWFKGITVLLTTSILACSVNRAPRLWKIAFHPRVRMGESFFAHAPLKANVLVAAAPDQAMDDVREVLTSHRFRTIADPDDNGLNLYADRFRWGPFGTVVAHLSFVVILLGFFLSATTGFKNTQFTAPVGSKVAVGHETGLTVEAKSFSDVYYPDGSPKDYASELVLYKNGVEVERQTVRVNHPMKFGGVAFYQSFFGVAASMKVQDAAGKTVFGDADNASGQTDPNIKAGQVELEVHQDGKDDPVATQVVDQGKPTTIAGLSYTFERPRQFTGLIVAQDPGAIFVWIGSTLLVIGLFLVFFFPHRRVWVRVRKTSGGTEILCASTMKRDVAFEPQFHQLVTDIQLAGTPSSTTQEVGQNHA